MERNPFYGKLLRSSFSRPFPRLCVPSVALNPISLTNADCVHHAFEEIGLIKKSFPFSEINFHKIKFFSELRQAPPLPARRKDNYTEKDSENGLRMNNEMTMKEKRFSFFLQTRKKEKRKAYPHLAHCLLPDPQAQARKSQRAKSSQHK